MGRAFLSSYTGRGVVLLFRMVFFGGRSRQAVDLSYQRLSVSDPCMEVSGIVWSMAGLLHLDFLVLWVGWVEAASWGVNGRSSLHLGSSNAYVPGIIMAFFAW